MVFDQRPVIFLEHRARFVLETARVWRGGFETDPSERIKIWGIPLEHPENVLKKGQGKFGAHTYKTKPLNSVGFLEGTGDMALDGEVKDAFELIDRLAKSRRVQQSIIRHAFRYFMGRNEMLSDSQTLIDAETAYVKSGGSFKMVVLSLLTSDSFIYRKKPSQRNE